MESTSQKYNYGREITLLELIEECELEQRMINEEESTSKDSEGKRNSNTEVKKQNL
jgi:hypothetical protein